jgi:hypothetical protein
VPSAPHSSALSVVIGSNAPESSLEACLEALERQRDGAEVIVCESTASPAALRRRFDWVRFVDLPGGLVPELWREGIEHSSGEIVALTISPMVPAGDWLETLQAQHRRYDAVGGAIDPAPGIRIRDWAEYFCRYAGDMLPFEGHGCLDIPGDNASYKRDLLERTRVAWRDGFWEPVVHRQLAADDVELWHAPELVVRQGRSAGTAAFVRQRLRHGCAHGLQRGVHFGRLRNLAGVLGAPLVPALLTVRILRQVWTRRRHRFHAVLALPLIVLFNVAWAVGEAQGHLTRVAAR